MSFFFQDLSILLSCYELCLGSYLPLMAEYWGMGENRKNSFTLSVTLIHKKMPEQHDQRNIPTMFFATPFGRSCKLYLVKSCCDPQCFLSLPHNFTVKINIQCSLPCKITAIKEVYLTISNGLWDVCPATNWWSRLHFQDATTMRLWDVMPGRNQSTCSLHMNIPPRREKLIYHFTNFSRRNYIYLFFLSIT